MAEKFKLNLTVVNKKVDPTWYFMTLDWDGKIRMDCSSPYAMASLTAQMSDNPKFDIATGNDADADRHGIVTKDAGLMNPNHFLSVAISYLFKTRVNWPLNIGIGKTLVSSMMIDNVAKMIDKKLVEVPVGFKFFVDGLLNKTIGFGGEESAGASFLKFSGNVWTTDKDGIIMDLLASEILAKTGKSPSEIYKSLEDRFGKTYYERIDAPATEKIKAGLTNNPLEKIISTQLDNDPIISKVDKANGAPIGGIKVSTENGWFAARPSGTENVYKIYAESNKSEESLKNIQNKAKEIVDSLSFESI
jgi:phosphoglucomutase